MSRDINILFEPLNMSNLSLKNRFFMAPMGTTFDLERLEHYLVARARGEVALITTPEICVHESGRVGLANEPRLEKDGDIESLSPLTAAVKKAGAKIVAQLNHAGRYAFARVVGRQSVAPSAVASRYTGETPRELSTNEVDDLVLSFADAALRARQAGFDGIEFMACSGYLISEFLSPLTNRRNDGYGGDLFQRAKFLLSILEETRKRVGQDFNICIKLDADDGMKGGKTLEDTLKLAPHIVKGGADRLHIWAGWHEASRPMLPMSVIRGAFSFMSAAVKKVTPVPVSTVGRINDPDTAAGILARGEADLIGLGRALLCDSDFVRKIREGRRHEIRKCTACCHCFDQIMRAIRGDKQAELACSLNPELGREGDHLIRPAAKRRSVFVIGGGPAGMEAARVCALRGHRVTLFEEEDHLGGMLNIADKPPHKEELRNIVDYYTAQMEALQVDVRLNTVLNPETLQSGGTKPDVVFLASGARESIPGITGIRQKHVLTAIDVLKGKAATGDKVIVVGGGMIGVETAEWLADAGQTVTLIEMLDSIASDVGPSLRWGLISRIQKKVTVLTQARVTRIHPDCVEVEESQDRKRLLPADTVVIAAGLTSRRELVPDLKLLSDVELHIVGSSREPGQIVQAVSDSFHIARKI